MDDLKRRKIRNVYGAVGDAAWMYVKSKSIEFFVDSRLVTEEIAVFHIDRHQLKALLEQPTDR